MVVTAQDEVLAGLKSILVPENEWKNGGRIPPL